MSISLLIICLVNFKSAYRQHHSSETAMVKVHNDIVQLLDSDLNVMVMSFDLSCAFDTVNHQRWSP